MTQLSLQDGIIQIVKNELANTSGSFSHTGDYNIAGTLTAETINVKNLVTDSGSLSNIGNWIVQQEADLTGKGFSWVWGDGGTQLIYRTGGRIWSNGSFDLQADKSYMIDGVALLSATELGGTVTKSRLREIGNLKNLTVTGDAVLSEFAVFNSALGRLGLNNEEPNGTLSVVENDVEVIISSPQVGVAVLGTYTNHNLEIISDNTTRITVKNNGEVVFGNKETKTADVKIYGTLTVENIISDTRVDRFSSLEFKASKGQTEFGQGLVWSGSGNSKTLMLRSDPVRIWSSEDIDVGFDKAYYVDGSLVIGKTFLGNNVRVSNLSTLGTLESLNVGGEATFLSDINASRGTVFAKQIVFNEGANNLSVKSSGLSINNDDVFYADTNEINIGNKNNTRRAVKVFGQLSLNANNPDPNVEFTVNGNVSFGGKKFITSDTQPINGSFVKGDICWNEKPSTGHPIGWVCIATGTPGEWRPFGTIG